MHIPPKSCAFLLFYYFWLHLKSFPGVTQVNLHKCVLLQWNRDELFQYQSIPSRASRCEIFIGVKEYYLVLPINRYVVSTVYSVLSRFLWKKTTNLLLKWDLNPWPLPYIVVCPLPLPYAHDLSSVKYALGIKNIISNVMIHSTLLILSVVTCSWRTFREGAHAPPQKKKY